MSVLVVARGVLVDSLRGADLAVQDRRPVELVARAVEIDAVTRAVEFGAGAVISGDAGVGKTALAGAVADGLAERGAAVVRVQATAAGRSIPFAALGPLLPADTPGFHPALMPSLVLRSLSGMPGRGRPVLLVDDAQLLDDHSAAALLIVLQQGGARALVTVRTGGRPPDAVTALWKEGLLERIDLHPLDLQGTRELLRAKLDGEVASTTCQLLWHRSQGNPLYLTELARFGLETGNLYQAPGVWWWSASGSDVPPRLDELLQRRLGDLSPAAAEARDVLALGEPLPYETLAAVASAEAILELDERGIVTGDAGPGTVRLRFSHPLLFAVAARRLSATRRRILAGRLLAAPADGVDVLRRAAWQEAAGGEPDVELLIDASRSLIVADPATSLRYAQRALDHDGGPGAAVALADAAAELGRPAEALAALAQAATKVRGAEDDFLVGVSKASLLLWSLRRPAEALDVLRDLESRLPERIRDLPRSAAALITLFSGRPAEAIGIADSVLAGSPETAARRRSLVVRLGALMVADRPAEARQTSADLAVVLASPQVPAPARSLAAAIAATATLFGDRTGDLPSGLGASGRWPSAEPLLQSVPPVGTAVPNGFPMPPAGRDGRPGGGPAHPEATVAGPAWPLLDGVRHHLAGNCAAAAVALREATVQQHSGEGLFRSEATGGLSVVLAELGRVDEAERVLSEDGPDDVALIPGMRGWAQAWVLAARGRRAAAGELAVQTAKATAAVGAVSTAFWHLADAARFGATELAAAAADDLADQVRSDLTMARLLGIRARAAGDPQALLEAAEAHLAVGVFGHAAELADLALAGVRRGSEAPIAARASAIGALARRSIGDAPVESAPAASSLPEQLTRREVEIATLAAQGLRDKDIANELVLSVRTVESHLATAYRKLGITSRRELGDALATALPRGLARTGGGRRPVRG